MNEREKLVAWAAGFFDGEGCVTVTRCVNKPTHKSRRGKKEHVSYQLVLRVGQRVRAPLETLQEVFGGTITPHMKCAELYWKWSSYGADAPKVLAELLPLLRVKREAALLAIEFSKTVGMWRGTKGRPPEVRAFQEETWHRLKEINTGHRSGRVPLQDQDPHLRELNEKNQTRALRSGEAIQ